MEKRRQLKEIGYVKTRGRSRRVIGQKRYRAIEHEIGVSEVFGWPYRALEQTRGDNLEPACDIVLEDGDKVYFCEYDNDTESMKQIASTWRRRYENTPYVVLVVATSSERRNDILAATPYLHEFALYGLAAQVAADPYGHSYINYSGQPRSVAEAYC